MLVQNVVVVVFAEVVKFDLTQSCTAYMFIVMLADSFQTPSGPGLNYLKHIGNYC